MVQTHSSPSDSPPAALPGLDLVQGDMLEMDALIRQRLSSGVPLVGEVAHYIIHAGGKRLRPVLLFLCSNALGCKNPHRLPLAAVVEFIHTATLLHDDVVDESSLRRGKATANARFGNPASVLVGDFLYSRAFQMMVEVQNMRVMDVLAEATNVIAEGEVQQLMNMRNADITVDDYLHVIRSKTAKLFEASARVGALIADASPAVEAACATYGQALGTAFQVIDDVLDYAGDSTVMGKNLGDDLREGKATLPLIAAMQRGSAAQAQLIRHAIEKGHAQYPNDPAASEAHAELTEIIQIVRSTGALEITLDAARKEIERAVQATRLLPTNQYSEAMAALAMHSLQRQF